MDEIPIKVAKITSNDTQPLIYLPKCLSEIGFSRGSKVLLKLDQNGRLIIEKIQELRGGGEIKIRPKTEKKDDER
jgi:hypothetical protein